MAVGDSLNAIINNASSYQSFQPAAGVAILLTSVGISDNGTIKLYDGANECTFAIIDATVSTPNAGGKVETKIIINNTTYLYTYSDGRSAYCGIQIE